MRAVKTTAGKRVEVQKFPLVGDGGILLYEEVGTTESLWTPCQLRDGLRNFGKLKPYSGERPEKSGRIE